MLAHMEPFGEYVIASDLQVAGSGRWSSEGGPSKFHRGSS